MRLSKQEANFLPVEVADCDQLRNVNCYEYLYNLVLNTFPDNENIVGEQEAFSFLREFKQHEFYDPKFPYGNLYTQFFYALEGDIENSAMVWPPNKKTLLLDAVFFNQNSALERAAQLKNLSPPTSPINTITPENMDGALQKVRTMMPGMIANSMFGGWALSSALSFVGATEAFKPMFGTSMLSVKKYRYQSSIGPNCPIELRSGTQSQYVGNGTARLNPIFDVWLISQHEKNPDNTCIYFNSLGYDIPVIKDYQDALVGAHKRAERLYERNLTMQLHAAEERHRNNLIMITLPADKGLLNSGAYLSTDPFISIKAAAEQMFAIVSSSNKAVAGVPVKDFYMSEAAEKKIYQSELEKKLVLRKLIADSFQKILNFPGGWDQERMISQAEYQAVYFHFIKYELTHFIVQKISPKTLIFACKDGIDRAGVASLYYNLMQSIHVGVPFTEEEFDRALDAAAKYVKGRPMNHHRMILWNVVHHLLNANVVVVPEWLQKWHDTCAIDASQNMKHASPAYREWDNCGFS